MRGTQPERSSEALCIERSSAQPRQLPKLDVTGSTPVARSEESPEFSSAARGENCSRGWYRARAVGVGLVYE